MIDSKKLAWDKMQNLIPVVVQDAKSLQVLMLGYMNQEALARTIEENYVTFYSRTKNRLWTKGETSGNFLKLVSIAADCDNDSLLILADPQGPTCHQGTQSCFANATANSFAFLSYLETIIHSRIREENSTSYTAKLYASGVKRMAQKVGEEGVEVALAAATKDQEEFLNESADLLYHLLVLFAGFGIKSEQVIVKLINRHVEIPVTS